jgi:hypothetical protein
MPLRWCYCMLCLLLYTPKLYVQKPLRKKTIYTLCIVLVYISLGLSLITPPLPPPCCPWNKHHDHNGRDFCCRLILVLSSLSRQMRQRQWHSPPSLSQSGQASLIIWQRGWQRIEAEFFCCYCVRTSFCWRPAIASVHSGDPLTLLFAGVNHRVLTPPPPLREKR